MLSLRLTIALVSNLPSVFPFGCFCPSFLGLCAFHSTYLCASHPTFVHPSQRFCPTVGPSVHSIQRLCPTERSSPTSFLSYRLSVPSIVFHCQLAARFCCFIIPTICIFEFLSAPFISPSQCISVILYLINRPSLDCPYLL